MVAAIPYIVALISALKIRKHITKVIDYVALSSSVGVLVNKHHKAIMEDETSRVSKSVSNAENIAQIKPTVEDTVELSNANPITLPDYLKQSNELVESLIQQQKNTALQQDHANVIQAEILKALAKTAEHADTQTSILNATLPAMVLQLQEVAKIAGALSIMSDIDVAYKELEITRHEELITALQNLDLSVSVPSVEAPAVNVINQVVTDTTLIEALTTATTEQTQQVATIASNLNAVSANAIEQKKVAQHLTTVAQITRMDGSVYAELTPLELGLKKDVSLVEAKTKEKEIGDYHTTVQDIKNLDGNTVATMKPIEATTAKNITDAKNATDEMEFEIPDDVFDEVFKPLVLPSYQFINWDSRRQYIYNGSDLS
ncbi:hypothetical protein [Sulfurimonas sp.]|uniref:hypothetical protein n=1 Tax=Sulfurimonas sp. TaxID=2022749 RepID=UPI003562D819